MKLNIKFNISGPQGKFSVKDNIVLNMFLTNKDKESVYMNSRFAAVPHIGDVHLKVDHDGKEVPFKFRVRLMELKSNDFHLLRPDETIIAGLNLSKGYNLATPGDYQILAQYHTDEIPKELKGQNVFQGTIKSEPIFFSLI